MTFEQQIAEHLALNNSDYTRLILDTLPGETHKEKFDYLVKLMHDRDTYKSEIEAAENIARRVIKENKILKSENEDLRVQCDMLDSAINRAWPYIEELQSGNVDEPGAGIVEDSELNAIYREFNAIVNGGYTDKELNCKGCFGPCGRCEETKD